MSLRFTRGAALLALVASLLVAVPACKKKKPTQPDSPSPGQPGPQPNPNPGGGRDPSAPRSPVFSGISTAPMRDPSLNNLKQIGFALHAYHDANGFLPGGIADRTGKPGLSWRVAILPYIEQDQLYKQFKLDEPWDSDHNKKLLSRMPKVFAPPRQDTNGYTFYRGFSGPNTWMPPARQMAQPGQPIRGVALTSITDGASNTLMVAEAYDPVIWTKPDELEFEPTNVPKLGGVFSTGVCVLMANGSTRFLRGNIDSKVLASAIQTNDGGIVNLDE